MSMDLAATSKNPLWLRILYSTNDLWHRTCKWTCGMRPIQPRQTLCCPNWQNIWFCFLSWSWWMHAALRPMDKTWHSCCMSGPRAIPISPWSTALLSSQAPCWLSTPSSWYPSHIPSIILGERCLLNQLWIARSYDSASSQLSSYQDCTNYLQCVIRCWPWRIHQLR